jgi:DNA-binding GntR family transcriptional regulator
VVSKLLESISGRTIRARIWRGITEGGAIDRTVAEHQAICDAIERRSPELARAWMAAHIGSVEAWLRHALEASRDGAEDGAGPAFVTPRTPWERMPEEELEPPTRGL